MYQYAGYGVLTQAATVGPIARGALDRRYSQNLLPHFVIVHYHNGQPFRRAQVDLKAMNNYGSTLVWGHPNAPMGTRGILELIEELALRGGGYGLFTGCAAGDSSMAIVLQVSDKQ